MTYDERFEARERERARIAEKETRRFKWAAGCATSLIGIAGYAVLSILYPPVPVFAAFVLFGFFLICLLKAVELRNEINRATNRLVWDHPIVAPTGHGKGIPFPERQSSFN